MVEEVKANAKKLVDGKISQHDWDMIVRADREKTYLQRVDAKIASNNYLNKMNEIAKRVGWTGASFAIDDLNGKFYPTDESGKRFDPPDDVVQPQATPDEVKELAELRRKINVELNNKAFEISMKREKMVLQFADEYGCEIDNPDIKEGKFVEYKSETLSRR